MKKQTDDEKKDKRKRIIIYIIIIIIIILSLITSCSCTSKFWGILGKFNNSGNYNIDDDTENLETITNKDLTFDNDYLEMLLSDNNGKLSFSYKNINPHDFSCTTSDASIATCYVSNGYVVVNSKAVGEVNIILQTKSNGKIYEATAKVVIIDTEKSIELSSNSGTINLAYSKYKSIIYKLESLSGDVKVTTSDSKVATATANNGILKITAYKPGDVTITVSINYNGKEYQNVYNLKVVNYKNNGKPSGGSSSNSGNDDKPNIPDTPEEPSIPDNPDVPSEPSNPDNPSTPSAPSLVIIPNKGFDIIRSDKDKNIYEMEVSYEQDKVPFKVSPSDGVIYKMNRESSNNISDLKLLPGWNIIEITSSRGKATVKVYKSKLKIQVASYVACNFGQDCNIPYEIVEIFKDGSISKEGIFDKEKYAIDIKSEGAASVKIVDGVIVVVPESTIENNAEIKIAMDIKNYDDEEVQSIVKFSVDDYYVRPAINNYEMRYTTSNNKNIGEKVVVVNTNLFKEKIDVTQNGSNIKICATDNSNLCVEVTVPDEYKDKISISFNKQDEEGIKFLPIKIKVKDSSMLNNEENIVIKVKGNAYTKEIGPEIIEVKLIKAYVVNLDFKNDKFNTTTNSLFVDYNGSGDLAEYEPIWYDSEAGIYHEFLGYSKRNKNNEDYQSADIDYPKGSKILGNELNDNITLYAVYAKDSTKIPCEMLAKTFWIKDLEIFNNEEAENLYGDNKLIYPGANGSYEMKFKNNTSFDEIYITDLTLKEDTICVQGGCLNMGYIIRANEPEREYYFYGKLKDSPYDKFKNENYKILNEKKEESNTKDISLEDIKAVQVKKTDNDYDASITIFWKWIDYDTDEMNKVDTLIGKEAANSNDNLLYTLSVGVTYKVPDDVCE